MSIQHKILAGGRWHELSLMEQMGNVGSEIHRAASWRQKDEAASRRAAERALELLDLTIGDPRWRRRLKEIARAREMTVDAMYGGKEYGNTLESLDRYFFTFAFAARIKK